MQQLTAYTVQGCISKFYGDTGCALLLLDMKPESTSSSIQGSCPTRQQCHGLQEAADQLQAVMEGYLQHSQREAADILDCSVREDWEAGPGTSSNPPQALPGLRVSSGRPAQVQLAKQRKHEVQLMQKSKPLDP